MLFFLSSPCRSECSCAIHLLPSVSTVFISFPNENSKVTVKWTDNNIFIFLPNLTLLAGLHPLLHSGSCCVLFASVVQNLNGPNSDSCDHLLQDVVDEPDLAREPRNMYVITSPVTISLCFMFLFFSLLVCFNESLINVAGETGLHTQFASRA